jgi:putative DNA primase/helicase
MARCPAHTDKTPSLSIGETDNGAVLLHCHAGCDTGDVLSAIGLSLRDLFEKPLHHHLPPTRQDWHLQDAIGAIAYEARIVATAASDIAAGERLSDENVALLAKAAGRIGRAYRRLYESR